MMEEITELEKWMYIVGLLSGFGCLCYQVYMTPKKWKDPDYMTAWFFPDLVGAPILAFTAGMVVYCLSPIIVPIYILSVIRNKSFRLF